jgi:hypothetical protein
MFDNISPWSKMITTRKHSSLFGQLKKKYRNTNYCGLYYKILEIRNLQEIDRFHSKVVSFCIGKYISFNKQTH